MDKIAHRFSTSSQCFERISDQCGVCFWVLGYGRTLRKKEQGGSVRGGKRRAKFETSVAEGKDW